MESSPSTILPCLLSPSSSSSSLAGNGSESCQSLLIELVGDSLEKGQLHNTDGHLLLCISHIPDILIPRQLIQFFSLYQQSMGAFRLLRHLGDYSRYVGLFSLPADVFPAFLEHYQDKVLTSLLSVRCHLSVVQRLTLQSHHHYEVIPNWSAFLLNQSQEQEEEGRGGPDDKSEILLSCPLCLETFKPSLSSNCFTTFCGHTFHLTCLANLEGVQCPVCRFDHEAQDSLHCQSCGCTNLAHLWLCLLCGFIGCDREVCGHIEDHYESSQHTYAIHLVHQVVYDFAGQGYVDRLLLGQSNDSSRTGKTKLVEHSAAQQDSSSPSALSCSDLYSRRREQPILSFNRQNEVVQSKAHTLSQQYQELLAWRMQENRSFYEAKIEQIRSWISENDIRRGEVSSPYPTPIVPTGDPSSRRREWRVGLKASLANEAQKIRKQCDLLRNKVVNLEKEVELQRELRKGLLGNQSAWETKVQSAQQRLESVEKESKEKIDSLQHKLQGLMVRLEGK
eukprot:gene3147-3446_t